MGVEIYLRMADDDFIRESANLRSDIGNFLWPELERDASERVSLGAAFGEIDEILQKYSPGARGLERFLKRGGVLLGSGEFSAKAFASSEVREIAAIVAKVSDPIIHRHCTEKFRLGEPMWTLEQFLSWLLPYFQAMREFLSKAVAREKGILVYASV